MTEPVPPVLPQGCYDVPGGAMEQARKVATAGLLQKDLTAKMKAQNQRRTETEVPTINEENKLDALEQVEEYTALPGTL